jgi:hypothetical protein
MTYIAFPSGDDNEAKKRKTITRVNTHIEAIQYAKKAGWYSLTVEDPDTGERYVYYPNQMFHFRARKHKKYLIEYKRRNIHNPLDRKRNDYRYNHRY